MTSGKDFGLARVRLVVAAGAALMLAPLAALAQGQTAPPPTAGGPQAALAAGAITFYACYVKTSGTVYRIKLEGLPQSCGANAVEFTWSEAVATAAAKGGGAGGTTFSALTTGTNTQAAMEVGSGASLTATGTGSIVATALASGVAGKGGFKGIVLVLTSGTYTPSAGVTSIIVECVGGGGAGGSVGDYGAGEVLAGGGGGAGAYSRRHIAVSPGATFAVTIGAGGVPSAGSPSFTGGVGGTTTFGGNLVTCPGGRGGEGWGALGDYKLRARQGGQGGPFGVGTLNTTGQPGGPGLTTSSWAASGAGGSSPFGAGGFGLAREVASNLELNGNNGTDKGAGGGGALMASWGGSGYGLGGTGSPGLVVVYEFY